MKLNIHLVSHPIIENLSEAIVHDKTLNRSKNNGDRYFGLLLVYEAIRDWSKIYRIHVKQIKSEQKTATIDPKESYIIILNNSQYFSYFQEVENLLPKINLAIVREDDTNKANRIMIGATEINRHAKVIVVLDKLQSRYVINLLDCLIKQQKISINQIRLISMVCTEDEIIRLSHRYSQFSIYTSKISYA